MSTTLLNSPLFGEDSTPASSETFSKTAKRFQAARASQGRQLIAAHLADLSDDVLARLGQSPEDIKQLREAPRAPLLWI